MFTVPPNIIDSESSSDTLATEGMRVLLNCKAGGNPTPTISWVREDGKNIKICDKVAGGGGGGGGGNGRRNKGMDSNRKCEEGKTKISFLV